MPTRFALLGFGRWGQRYADAIDDVDGASLIEVFTRDPERRKLAADRATVVDDWHQAVRSSESDAVVIATPPSTHGEMLRACFAAGKPAIVEKPLCLDECEARTLADQANAAGVQVLVDHTLLFNPAYERLKEEARSLGSIRFVASEGMAFGPFRRDATALWDWAPHDVACCLDLTGELPSTVDAFGAGAGQEVPSEPERVAVRLNFPNGAAAWIHIGRLSLSRRRSLEVFCDKGALRFSDGETSVLDFHDAPWDGRHRLPSTFRLPNPTTVFQTTERPLTRMVDYFVRGVAGTGDTGRFGLGLAADVVGVIARAQQRLHGTAD